MDRALHASSRGLNALLCLIGVAMVVSTLARGGGPLALGVVLGVLFAVLGAARLRLAGAACAGAEPRGDGAEDRIARGLGEPALFAIAASAIGSSLYYILGRRGGPGARA